MAGEIEVVGQARLYRTRWTIFDQIGQLGRESFYFRARSLAGAASKDFFELIKDEDWGRCGEAIWT